MLNWDWQAVVRRIEDVRVPVSERPLPDEAPVAGGPRVPEPRPPHDRRHRGVRVARVPARRRVGARGGGVAARHREAGRGGGRGGTDGQPGRESNHVEPTHR